MIEAVIFDFDGVIADTMQDNYNAWKKALRESNISIEPIDYFQLEGMGRYEIASYFISKNNLSETLTKVLVEKKEQYYKENNNFKIFSYIVDLLDLLKNSKIKIGLVTGASKDRIHRTLEKKFSSYFDYIVTADDVTNCKPNPEPYQKCIEKLGVRAQCTLVIENAPFGIKSAKAAGAICYALETTLNRIYLVEAENIFENHKSLYFYLKNQLSFNDSNIKN